LRPDGTLRLADTTMVALARLVAESAPKQKDLMIRLVLNLIEDERWNGGSNITARRSRPY
jgi:hypothetical protein